MTLNWRHTPEMRGRTDLRSCEVCDRAVRPDATAQLCDGCTKRRATGVARLALDCTDRMGHAERDSLWQAVQGALIAASSVSAAGGAGGGKVKDDTVLGRTPQGESTDWIKKANQGDPAWWHREYMRFPQHWIKCEVVRRAGEYLAALERRPDVLYDLNGDIIDPDQFETPEALNRRIVDEGEGYSIEDCVEKFNVPALTIRRARRADEREIATGHGLTAPPKPMAIMGRPTEVGVLVIKDRRKEVRRLRTERNLTVRAIAAILDISVGTVHNDLEGGRR